MPDRMTETYDRAEVITSVQRRRRWTPEEKIRIVEETYLPRNTVSLVARRHGIDGNQLFTWRRLMAQGAPLRHGPFYAVKVEIGDLGTFAGVRTDENARVLGPENRPIRGLYAAGNETASLMGGNYPGGGITLGPAVTFGYIAARHMSGANA